MEKQILDDFTSKDMCQNMLMQSSQKMAMQMEETKNEMEIHCQKIAIHWEMLTSQQQMMNIVMMEFVQQSSKKQ